MSGIRYIDGIRLQRSLSAGIQRVISRQDYLNKINVFPVPDSDTGTNLAFTLSMIEDEINGKIHSDIHIMGASIADAALDNARGNSGAILAQFLVGFAEGLADLHKITSREFAHAAQMAKHYAYEALLVPQEGTILTVISDWAACIQSKAHKVRDFRKLLAQALDTARQSLADTPQKLAVLAKANVVDAGAQGFVDFLEGIQDYIERGELTFARFNAAATPDVPAANSDYTDTYRFCTECLVKNDPVDRIGLKEALQGQGDSIVIAGTKSKARIHIHTDEPKTVIEICRRFGDVTGEKADDMWRQQADAQRTQRPFVVVVDSGCDLSEEDMETHNIHMVPVRLNFGDRHYVDKVTMSVDEFWDEMAQNPIHPQTSQPTPGDFRRQYQFLASHYEAAISIHLPAALSGTYQSAWTATRAVNNFPTRVIDSYSGSIGLGLIAIRASEGIEAGMSFDSVVRLIDQAIANTTIYIGLENLNNVVKGGRVSPSKKRIANLFRINPVLTFSAKGVHNIGVTFGKKDKVGKLIRFVTKRLPEKTPYRVGISHALNPTGLERAVNYFTPLVGENNIFTSEIGPALGVHSGPGGLVIAIQTLEDSLNE